MTVDPSRPPAERMGAGVLASARSAHAHAVARAEAAEAENDRLRAELRDSAGRPGFADVLPSGGGGEDYGITRDAAVLRKLVEKTAGERCCPGDDGWGTCGGECRALYERWVAMCDALHAVESEASAPAVVDPDQLDRATRAACEAYFGRNSAAGHQGWHRADTGAEWGLPSRRDSSALDLLREMVAAVGACSCPCDCDYDATLDAAEALLAGQPAAPDRSAPDEAAIERGARVAQAEYHAPVAGDGRDVWTRVVRAVAAALDATGEEAVGG